MSAQLLLVSLVGILAATWKRAPLNRIFESIFRVNDARLAAYAAP